MALAAAALAACGHSGDSSTLPAATTTTSTAPASTPATSAAPASTATTAAPSTATTAAAPGICPTGVLTPSVGSPNGAAGSTGYVLSLRNTGSRPCVLRGYPGVSAVTGADGRQLGAAATRDPGPEPTVLLAPGRAAEASVIVVDAGNFPAACAPAVATGLQIYPPGDYLALFLPMAVTTCADHRFRTLRVGPVQVGPIST